MILAAKRDAAMNVFIVSQFGAFWAVVNHGVVISRSQTSTSALYLAIRSAALSSGTQAEPAQVMLEDDKGNRVVMWDSRQDSFSEA